VPESILLYCRAGFEKECAQEIAGVAQAAGIEGYVKARPESGYAAFTTHDEEAGQAFGRKLDLAAFVFPRQLVRAAQFLTGLEAGDRIAPMVAAAVAHGKRFRAIVLEMPDTNDGKALTALTRPLKPRLERGLANAGVRFDDPDARDRLHFFFVGGAACYVGVADCARSSPWPMGIARLRMPGRAPSRSTLKLAEAFLEFLGAEDSKRRLRPGMTAVDLGASPGGWSWQLARRGLSVTAVDNGPMDAAVLDTGLVKHLRADGFRFEPKAPVDWMVCDIVEQPARVAALAARWIAEGWCRECIFNLKLPMKKRWEEVRRCAEIVASALVGVEHRLRMRQLYHDREEVTAHLALLRQRR